LKSSRNRFDGKEGTEQEKANEKQEQDFARWCLLWTLKKTHETKTTKRKLRVI